MPAEPSDADILNPPAGEPVELGDAVLRPGAAIGAYRYERVLGKGGMAMVLLVRDPSGDKLALKVLLKSRLTSGLHRFRREFRALARLSHPNVVRVDAYGDHHGHPYIAMEYAEGPDLYQSLRKYRDMPADMRWRRVEAVLIDICQALAYIHRRGLVHRDLKPSNVLQTLDGRCKLTDFGIVKDLEDLHEPGAKKTRVGTWAYCAPEQIAGHPVDHRADLYSLGVILYTMLTGRRPFNAEDMAGYLEAHRTQTPMPPLRLEPGIPRRLNEICLRLLAKAPRERFQSAAEILYILEQIDAAGQARRAPDDGAWELPLVGRDAELGTVQEALDMLRRGHGGVVLLEGAEGMGKSRLLRAGLAVARLRGVPVHVWRLQPQDGSYTVLRQIATEVGRELGDRAPPELGPAIQRFFGDRGELQGDLRYQLFDAVRDGLLLLLQSGPRVLAFDDLQYAPPPLLALLSYAVRGVVGREDLPLLLLATARPGSEVRAGGDDLPRSAVAAFLDGANLGVNPVAVTVGALIHDEVGRLIEGLAGPGEASRALSQRLYTETAGNPLFLVEFLRGLRQRGLLVPVGGGKHRLATDAGEISSGPIQVPPGVRAVVSRRLEPLGADERAILEILAVAERALDQDALLEALVAEEVPDEGFLAEEDWLDRLDALVEVGLLVERRDKELVRYEFSHGTVGEVVYRDLTPLRRAGLHRRLGDLLSRRAPDSPAEAEAIGEHYRRAGEIGLSWRALVRAAVHLWERSLLAEGWDLAQRAATLEDQAENELQADVFRPGRRELLRVRADALFNRGLWEEARIARERLVRESEDAGDLRQRDAARLGLGVLLRRLGRHAEGEQMLANVLSDARERRDRVTVLDALRNLCTLSFDKGDLDETERLATEGLVLATGPEHASGRAHMLLALATVQAARGQLAAATAGLVEAEEILQRLRVKRTLCLATCNLAEIQVWQGDLGGAVLRATEALTLAEELLFRVGEASACRVRAMALLEIGALDEAARDIERSQRICDELDLAEDRVATCALLARLAFARGNPARALEPLDAGLVAARDWDPEGYSALLLALRGRALCLTGAGQEGSAVMGGVAGALSTLRPVRRVQVLVALAAGYVDAGLAERAIATAREASVTASARGLRVWALGARLILLALVGPEEARVLRGEAATLAHAITTSLPPDLARVLRTRLHAAGVG